MIASWRGKGKLFWFRLVLVVSQVVALRTLKRVEALDRQNNNGFHMHTNHKAEYCLP